MYFILSKILIYLLFPLTWVFILLVIFFVTKTKKRKQRFLVTAILLLYLFSNSFLFNQFVKLWDIPLHHFKSGESYKCAIVLGGFSGADNTEEGHFNIAADRFIQGVLLLKTDKVSHILIISGNGSLIPGSFREGIWAKSQLENLGIPDSSILIESNSKNTIENARFSNVILKRSNLKGPYLLITSAFHMRRALMIFKKEKIDIVPYSCNLLRINKLAFDDYFIPTSDALSGWNAYIKEIVGYMVNYFNG